MAQFSNELTSKLKKAASREEVEALLKAEGQDAALTDEVWKKAEELRARDGQELSLDELEDVAGGRSWWDEGCAATVEPGSDCWSTDGGCWISNVEYTGLYPNSHCPRCNRPAKREEWAANQGIHYYCRSCGEFSVPY